LGEEVIFEVDPKEVKRVLTETRAFFWLMVKYRYNPELFKEIPYEELFDLDTIIRLFFDLNGLLNDFGIVIDAEI
jgi:hypothetical protein